MGGVPPVPFDKLRQETYGRLQFQNLTNDERMNKKRVLIVCTGNACRSQMAEALWRADAGDRYEVCSAGTHPAGVHPIARLVIEELGIDTSELFSKSVYELAKDPFDLVITVCDDAREICPIFLNAAVELHWPIEDPVMSEGTLDERLPLFRQTRDLIRQKIRQFLESESATSLSQSPTDPA
jgi:arsenate reductase (thioredoxin)